MMSEKDCEELIIKLEDEFHKTALKEKMGVESYLEMIACVHNVIYDYYYRLDEE